MSLYRPKAHLHIENCVQPWSSCPKRTHRTKILLEREAHGQEWIPYKEYVSRQLFRQVKSQLDEEDRGPQNHEWHNTESLTISTTEELRATKWRKPAENKQKEGILYTARRRLTDKQHSWPKAVEAAMRSQRVVGKSGQAFGTESHQMFWNTERLHSTLATPSWEHPEAQSIYRGGFE